MSYIALNPQKYLRQSIGSGQCVAYVEKAADTPRTFYWRQGQKVKNNPFLKPGTAIATFQHGIYQNNTHGLSHAAIYLRQTPEAIYVLDQWIHKGKRHLVSERAIRFKNGNGEPVNDGDAYYVVETQQ